MKEKRTYKQFDLLSILAILGCAGMLLFEGIFIFEIYDHVTLPAEAPAPVRPAAIQAPATSAPAGMPAPAVEAPAAPELVPTPAPVEAPAAPAAPEAVPVAAPVG